MRRFTVVVLSFLGVLASSAPAQTANVEPVRISAGTVLTFHLQTRLKPTAGDALDALPEGTILRVKMLDSIDSSVKGDGSEFHGSIVSSVVSGDEVLVHPDAAVRGLLALLRSRNHPEGFRYELLVTSITERGETYALTASLNPSLFETGPSESKAGTKKSASGGGAANSKLP